MSEVQYWVWPVSVTNWNIVKNNKIWATYSESATKKVRKGHFIVFYLVGEGVFSGSFRLINDWYENRELVWPDEYQENQKKVLT